jgi:hypothetical protein
MVTHTDDMVRDIVSALNETSSLYLAGRGKLQADELVGW